MNIISNLDLALCPLNSNLGYNYWLNTSVSQFLQRLLPGKYICSKKELLYDCAPAFLTFSQSTLIFDFWLLILTRIRKGQFFYLVIQTLCSYMHIQIIRLDFNYSVKKISLGLRNPQSFNQIYYGKTWPCDGHF